jgi:hypothetical protein
MRSLLITTRELARAEEKEEIHPSGGIFIL